MKTIINKNNPLESFNDWYSEAQKLENEAAGFSLATADKSGQVSNRFLLLKGIEDDQLVFVTNFDSDKAKQIQENSNVAMCFYWQNYARQIRIEGKAQKLSDELCDKYFLARAPMSRLASILSSQSRPINTYDELLSKFKTIMDDPAKHDINIEQRPSDWGAYGVKANLFEFFTYGEHRLNQRYQFKYSNEGSWQGQWLAP